MSNYFLKIKLQYKLLVCQQDAFTSDTAANTVQFCADTQTETDGCGHAANTICLRALCQLSLG